MARRTPCALRSSTAASSSSSSLRSPAVSVAASADGSITATPLCPGCETRGSVADPVARIHGADRTPSTWRTLSASCDPTSSSPACRSVRAPLFPCTWTTTDELGQVRTFVPASQPRPRRRVTTAVPRARRASSRCCGRRPAPLQHRAPPRHCLASSDGVVMELRD